MAIDIMNIEPSVISRDLRGKFVMLYSSPKAGKTTMACSFPNNLLLGMEHGWNAISGAMAIDITKWSEFKQVLRQLKKPEAKEKYDTITIDTVQIAYSLCEQYICAQHGVQSLSEVPWGKAYSDTQKEFENCLREITQLGYGLVLITHEEVRKEISDNDSEIEIVKPALNKRAYEVCNRLVDIIGYIQVEWNEDGTSERWLYTRRTPTVMAGSRFKYLEPKIKFGYDELVSAISKAIEKQEELDGAKVVDKVERVEESELSYSEIREKASKLWTELVEKDTENAQIILKKVEMIFGRKIKLSEITEDQKDLFNLVLLEMEEMAK